jgi:hypothetical protein
MEGIMSQTKRKSFKPFRPGSRLAALKGILSLALVLVLGSASAASAGKTIFAQNTVTSTDPNQGVAQEKATRQAAEASAAQCKGKKATGGEPNLTNINDVRNIGTEDKPLWQVTVTVRFTCK